MSKETKFAFKEIPPNLTQRTVVLTYVGPVRLLHEYLDIVRGKGLRKVVSPIPLVQNNSVA